jgi:hypothetical protein
VLDTSLALPLDKFKEDLLVLTPFLDNIPAWWEESAESDVEVNVLIADLILLFAFLNYVKDLIVVIESHLFKFDQRLDYHTNSTTVPSKFVIEVGDFLISFFFVGLVLLLFILFIFLVFFYFINDVIIVVFSLFIIFLLDIGCLDTSLLDVKVKSLSSLMNCIVGAVLTARVTP